MSLHFAADSDHDSVVGELREGVRCEPALRAILRTRAEPRGCFFETEVVQRAGRCPGARGRGERRAVRCRRCRGRTGEVRAIDLAAQLEELRQLGAPELHVRPGPKRGPGRSELLFQDIRSGGDLGDRSLSAVGEAPADTPPVRLWRLALVVTEVDGRVTSAVPAVRGSTRLAADSSRTAPASSDGGCCDCWTAESAPGTDSAAAGRGVYSSRRAPSWPARTANSPAGSSARVKEPSPLE